MVGAGALCPQTATAMPCPSLLYIPACYTRISTQHPVCEWCVLKWWWVVGDWNSTCPTNSNTLLGSCLLSTCQPPLYEGCRKGRVLPWTGGEGVEELDGRAAYHPSRAGLPHVFPTLTYYAPSILCSLLGGLSHMLPMAGVPASWKTVPNLYTTENGRQGGEATHFRNLITPAK